jgi:hypothetical protein
MARNDEWIPLPQASVWAAAIVVVVVTVVWGLPAIIHALGEAAALAIGAATAGVATAAPIASWVAPVAGVGVAATGAATVIVVLVKAAKEAAREPYEWTVPLLGILGGLVLDLAKEYGVSNPILRTGLTAVIAFLVVVAGACWKTGDWVWKTVAVILLLSPPVAVLLRNLEPSRTADLAAALRDVPMLIWLRLGGFVLLGTTVALVHAVLQRRSAR